MSITNTESATPLLLDAAALAKELGCSKRHVERLASSRALPTPVRLGRSVRWSRASIVRWIDSGCPDHEAEVARGES